MYRLLPNYRGKLRPHHAIPPSIFDNVSPSCNPSSQPMPRKTVRASSSVRNSFPDELEDFHVQDLLVVGEVEQKLATSNIVVYKDGIVTVIQSKLFHCGIPRFVVRIHDDLTFTTFHCGSACNVPSLVTNRITRCKYWSTLEEMLRYLRSKVKSRIKHKF